MHRSRSSLLPALLALLLAAPAPPPASAQTAQERLPRLDFVGPPEMAGTIADLEPVDAVRLRRVMALTGLDDPGPPIRVTVAPEGTPEARRVPSWVVGYAVGAAGLVVLLPARVPSYPDKSLQSVLVHEVAHVLVARAARRRPVPRWLDEGVAVATSRFGFEDRTRLIFASLRRGHPSLASLDEAFPAGPGAAARAYAFSGAVVRWLLAEHGDQVVARILAGIGAGLPFEEAFYRATGTSLFAAEGDFWRQITFWHKWVPFIGSSTFLWLLVTALALVAFYRRRRRDEEIRARWDAEDGWVGDEPDDGWVH